MDNFNENEVFETNKTQEILNNNNDNLSLKLDDKFTKELNLLGLMLQIFGVLLILQGASFFSIIFDFEALIVSIVFVVFELLMIIIGLKLYKTGKKYKQSLINKDGNTLKEALSLQASTMKIFMIMILALIVTHIIFIMSLASSGL